MSIYSKVTRNGQITLPISVRKKLGVDEGDIIEIALEEERVQEIGLNKLATDKVRDVLNAITPILNSSLANIYGDIESEGEELCKQLPSPQQEKVRKLLHQIQREAGTLETSIRGLLGLYRILYAHHAEAQEIDRLKKEIVDESKSA